MSTNQNNKMWFRWGFAALLVLGALGFFFNMKQMDPNIVAPNETPKFSEKVRTEERAHAIGKTLIEKNFELTRFIAVDQKRNMASEDGGKVEAVTGKVTEGQYGRDAWGHPFFFKVVGGKVFVWSNGENHNLDSSMDQIMSNNAVGDDIVISMSL